MFLIANLRTSEGAVKGAASLWTPMHLGILVRMELLSRWPAQTLLRSELAGAIFIIVEPLVRRRGGRSAAH